MPKNAPAISLSKLESNWWWKELEAEHPDYKKNEESILNEIYLLKKFFMPSAVFYEIASRFTYINRRPKFLLGKPWNKLTSDQQGALAEHVWPSFPRDSVRIAFDQKLFHPWMAAKGKVSKDGEIYPRQRPQSFELDSEGWTLPIPISFNMRHNKNDVAVSISELFTELQNFYRRKLYPNESKAANTHKFTAAEAMDLRANSYKLSPKQQGSLEHYVKPDGKHRIKIKAGLLIMKKLPKKLFS